MARNAKPTAIHELNGSYRKDPQRRRTDEPQPKAGVGPSPETVSSDWRECWDELVDCCCPGVLGDSDRIWLERAAKLLAKSRDEGAKWTQAEESSLQTYLARMGMSPSDRAKITAKPNDKKDPAEKYF